MRPRGFSSLKQRINRACLGSESRALITEYEGMFCFYAPRPFNTLSSLWATRGHLNVQNRGLMGGGLIGCVDPDRADQGVAGPVDVQ